MSGSEWVSVHDRMPKQGLWVLLAGGRVGSRHIDILGLAILNSWDKWMSLSGTLLPEAAVVEYWWPLPATDHLEPFEGSDDAGVPE